MQVKNLKDETLGDVEAVLADLHSGRLTALAVSTGEFIGIDDELSAVPATAFRFNEDRSALQLDTTREKLTAAPHFKDNNWPDFSNVATVKSIFDAHSVELYKVSADAQSSNASLVGIHGRVDSKSSLTTQGDSKKDMATTSAIRNEIRELKDISVNARNVNVTTLSGRVDNADEKRVISEIADRNVGKEEVDNQLVIKLASTESK